MAITTTDLREFTTLTNIADKLDDDTLHYLGAEVIKKFQEDIDDHEKWLEQYEQITDLANQVMKPKNWPWENASNVIVPLMAVAVTNFSSTVYSEIIRNEKVTKYKIIGRDEGNLKDERGKRVSKYINWQLLENMCEWQDETDKLLTRLALIGCVFRKVYYSPIKRRNISTLINPTDLIISKYSGDFNYAPRVTHKLEMRYNDIIEKQRSGIFLDIKLEKKTKDEETREFLEQHCWFDLDDDGYEEPYIVTVDRQTKQVMRMVTRFKPNDMSVDEDGTIIGIKPFNHFIKYTFLQPMDDSPYGDGFGKLLLPLNESIDSIINQLIDAGTISNVPGGLLGSGIRTVGGPFRVQPGEWQPVETTGASLADNVFTFPVKGPSPELFQLLQLLISFAQDLTRSKDIMSGDVPANTPATTLLAALEQAHRTYSTIYRRIYRSLRKEINAIYDLTFAYADEDEYINVVDDPQAELVSDFERKSFDIVPVASPEISSTTQKMIKSQVLIGALEGGSAAQAGIDARAIWEDFLLALGEDDIERYIPPPPDPEDIPPSIDEQMLQLQAEVAQSRIQIEQQKLDLKAAELENKMDSSLAEMDARINKMISEAIKNIATAEAAEVGAQLDIYKQELATLKGDMQALKVPEVQEAARKAEAEETS